MPLHPPMMRLTTQRLGSAQGFHPVYSCAAAQRIFTLFKAIIARLLTISHMHGYPQSVLRSTQARHACQLPLCAAPSMCCKDSAAKECMPSKPFQLCMCTCAAMRKSLSVRTDDK